jgi:hypothetical protein
MNNEPTARFLVRGRPPNGRHDANTEQCARGADRGRDAANPYLVERRTGSVFSGLFGGPKAPRKAGKPSEVSGALADVHASQSLRFSNL